MNEKPNTVERGDAKIREELATIARQIIELEGQLNSAHEESGGNSPEDNAQEAQTDITNRAIVAEKIQSLKLKEEALQASLSANRAA